jgi:hypothetical protein
VIIVLVLTIIAALILMSFDRQLSGGSALSPVYGIGFIVLCLAMIVFLVVGKDGFADTPLGNAFGLLPLFLVFGYCSYGQSKFRNRPEAIANHQLARNVRCAVEKAGLADKDRPFVSVRIRMIDRFGPPTTVREIEDRMGIRILPDCGFERRPAGSSS